jgi:hypothetical protein
MQVSDLWPHRRMHDANCKSAGRGLLVTRDYKSLDILTQWVRAIGGSISWSGVLEDANRFSWVAIDLDSMGGAIKMVGPLVSLRKNLPHLQVMALSSEFSADDLGSDRLAACDICLRLPLSYERLEGSFSWMYYNNQTWRNRVYDMTAYKSNSQHIPSPEAVQS